MGSKELAIFGGLLSGVGEGVLLKSRNRQKDEIAKRDAIIAKLKGDGGGMSADDKRLWDVTVGSKTTEGLEGKTQNWPAITTLFEEMGRLDLAELARQSEAPLDHNSDAYLAAEEAADKWIKEQASWFKTDSTDFKDFGGNREQARQAKIREFYQGSGTLQGEPAAPAEAATTASSGEYSTAEDVGEAYKNGKISKTEAARILREQFGYQ